MSIPLPQKIFVYGVPGSGKTTISERLATTLEYPVVEADRLRDDIGRSGPSQAEVSFIFLGTTEAWRMFGDLNRINVIRGLASVRDAMAPRVAKAIQEHGEPFVLEAAFLCPINLRHDGPVLLIVTEEKQAHENQFFQHRVRNQRTLKAFRAARILQDYMIKEAEGVGSAILFNRGSLGAIVSSAVRLIRSHDDP